MRGSSTKGGGSRGVLCHQGGGRIRGVLCHQAGVSLRHPARASTHWTPRIPAAHLLCHQAGDVPAPPRPGQHAVDAVATAPRGHPVLRGAPPRAARGPSALLLRPPARLQAGGLLPTCGQRQAGAGAGRCWAGSNSPVLQHAYSGRGGWRVGEEGRSLCRICTYRLLTAGVAAWLRSLHSPPCCRCQPSCCHCCCCWCRRRRHRRRCCCHCCHRRRRSRAWSRLATP